MAIYKLPILPIQFETEQEARELVENLSTFFTYTSIGYNSGFIKVETIMNPNYNNDNYYPVSQYNAIITIKQGYTWEQEGLFYTIDSDYIITGVWGTKTTSKTSYLLLYADPNNNTFICNNIWNIRYWSNRGSYYYQHLRVLAKISTTPPQFILV